MMKCERDMKIVRNVMLWLWNTDWPVFAYQVFNVVIDEAPDHKLQYLQRYKDMWSENPANLFSALDYDKMMRITDRAAQKYGVVE